MCGICGIARYDGEPVSEQTLGEACKSLRHRGPDAAGVWVDQNAASTFGLGAVRLAVLDPSPAGHQPMARHGGRYHLAYNGEIYNYRELRRELEADGETFQTTGDTEVVLAACAKWGTDAFHRFNGMWALAFYDSHKRCGFLSRDRFGIKPLFYSNQGKRLTFASELGALRFLGKCGSVDAQTVVQHLQFGFIAHPRTIYDGVRRLPPGHFINFDSTTTSPPKRYYDAVSVAEKRPTISYSEACSAVRQRLLDAVVGRQVSDVPVGVFLSGGLDSSIIALHASQSTGQKIKSFSVGYAGHDSYNETAYARLVAEALSTEHHNLIFTERDVVEAVPQVLDHLSEPVGDSSIIPTSLVSQFAREHVVVALGGDGGDELFGGYWRYLGHRSREMYERLPTALRSLLIEPALNRLASSKSSRLGNKVRQFRKLLRGRSADVMSRHISWMRILSPEAEKIFQDAEVCHQLDDELSGIAGGYLRDRSSANLNDVMAFDLAYQLPADMLQKVDLASMMHSLEVRVPFLDHEVAEIAMGLPASYKVHSGLRKQILVDAYRGFLPDEVLDRPKMGFEVPFGELLRGPLREIFSDVVTRSAVDSFDMLDYDGISEVLADHLSRRGEHADLLFALLSLCWWGRK